MADDWTWRDTLREWLWDTTLDRLAEFFKTLLGRLTIGEMIAAIVIAYAELKGHPEVLFLGIGAAGAFAFMLIWGGIQRLLSRPGTEAQIAEPEFAVVANQLLQNQEVPLDGYQYVGCTFKNVTFVYNNGPTGGFDSTCRVTGSFGFVSREKRIQQILGFLRSIGIVRPDAQGRFVPILNQELEPHGDAVTISSPDELAHYYARIVNLWNRAKEAEENFRLIKEYFQRHWDELAENRRHPMQLGSNETFRATL